MKQMKITLDECLSLKSIEKVVINSYEQSLYLVSVIVNDEERFVTDAVSYTHLTLPTICSV